MFCLMENQPLIANDMALWTGHIRIDYPMTFIDLWTQRTEEVLVQTSRVLIIIYIYIYIYAYNYIYTVII